MKLPTKDTLAFAVLTAVLTTTLSWLVEMDKSHVAVRNEVLSERREELKKQLSEFYYPIVLRLQEDEAYWENQTIWPGNKERSRSLNGIFGPEFEKEVILPNHEAIMDILNQHMNYLGPDEADLREQVLIYVQHVTVYKALRATGDKRMPFQVGAPFPEQFEALLLQHCAKVQHEYDKVVALQTGSPMPRATDLLDKVKAHLTQTSGGKP